MKQIYVPGLLLCFLSAALSAQPITLQNAVDIALKSDNPVKEAGYNINAAEAGLEMAKAARFGGFRLKGAYTDGDEPVYVFASKLKQGSFDMNSLASVNSPSATGNYMAGIEAGLPLYTGSSITRSIRTASLANEAAKDGYARAKSGAAFRTASQWLTVLLHKKLSSLAAETVSSAEAEVKTAQMLKEKGMVLGSDYYGAEAILSTFKGYKLEWEGALESDKEKLGLALGSGPVDAAGQLEEADYPEKSRDILAAAADSRRDVDALEKTAEISAISKEAAARSIFPVVEAFGAWETDSRTLSDFKDSVLGGIRMNIPLGDPAYFARKKAAAAETSAAQSRLAEARKQAGTEAVESYLAYKTAKAAIPVARETLEKARQSLELFRPLYRQGRQSVLEVLRAQAAVLQAETAYYEAVYRFHFNYIRMLFSVEALDAAAIADMSAKLSAR